MVLILIHFVLKLKDVCVHQFCTKFGIIESVDVNILCLAVNNDIEDNDVDEYRRYEIYMKLYSP